MSRIILMLLVTGALVSGCKTTEIASSVEAKDISQSVIGQPIQSVIEAHDGQRIRFFDADDKELKELPAAPRGSVSIHNQERTGQDNYIFDVKGVIAKHQRSYGEDYPKGVWTEVK